ncbi:MAG: ATP-dependent RNA helicase, partial [Lentisphaeria bacterium]|nr:ATP-dependent RNA helicase [Lentisphaeria bacterium]
MLPIYEIVPALKKALKETNRLVVSTPTGSGKSTQLPKILRNEHLCRRTLVLQPRRLAAVMLAKRVAEELQEKIGDTVGYITRHDRKMSKLTSICYATTGVALRMLQNDPLLSEWDCIIIDEFHERSVLQDLTLALVKDAQEKRDRLNLILMSATIKVDLLDAYLPNLKVLTSEGRSFPVEINYIPTKSGVTVWDAAKKALVSLLNSTTGDVLIFMPGAYEIRKTIESCKSISSDEKLVYLPLYSAMRPQDQQAVMEPNSKRKIVVATNIAETSLTISGVRHVIDSGLAKVNRFHPNTGLNALEVESISGFAATQRSGRAGREAAGSCMRLWRESTKPLGELEPEVSRIDLTETMLMILQFTDANSKALELLTPPREAAKLVALKLLQDFKFINENHTVTEQGLLAAQIPTHPRLAKLILAGSDFFCVKEATMMAALLSEKSIFINGKGRLKRLAGFFENRGEMVASRRRKPRLTSELNEDINSDLHILVESMFYLATSKFDEKTCQGFGINKHTALAVWKNFQHLVEALQRQKMDLGDSGNLRGLLKSSVAAFYDQLASRRDQSSTVCFTANGRANLSDESIVSKEKLFISTSIFKTANHTLLSGNLAVSLDLIEEVFPDAFTLGEKIEWRESNQRIEKHHVEQCLGVVIENKLVKDDDFYDRCGVFLAAHIVKNNLSLPSWNKEV